MTHDMQHSLPKSSTADGPLCSNPSDLGPASPPKSHGCRSSHSDEGAPARNPNTFELGPRVLSMDVLGPDYHDI